MAKKSNRRGQKKEIQRRFEQCFEAGQFNYKDRVKMVNPKAMLVGLITASVLYGVGFSIAYFAMQGNTLPLDTFAKIVWMLMIPTTIVGLFAWQLAKNRMEYPIRMQIRRTMEELEANGGVLWRFSPLLDLVSNPKPDVKKAFTWSAEGKIDKLDIEDYIQAVEFLEDMMLDTQGNRFSQQLLEDIEENFKNNLVSD